MRSREEIEKSLKENYQEDSLEAIGLDGLVVELLLDIRELLKKNRPIKTGNKH